MEPVGHVCDRLVGLREQALCQMTGVDPDQRHDHSKQHQDRQGVFEGNDHQDQHPDEPVVPVVMAAEQGV